MPPPLWPQGFAAPHRQSSGCIENVHAGMGAEQARQAIAEGRPFRILARGFVEDVRRTWEGRSARMPIEWRRAAGRLREP